MRYAPGQIIRFTYNHPPDGMDANTGPRDKNVLVLNPNYQGKMHGLDLDRLTDADRKVLKAILDPKNIPVPEAAVPTTTQALPKPKVSGSMHGQAKGLAQMSPEKRAEMMRLYGSPKQKVAANDMKWAQSQPLVKDILRRMNPLQEIKNPVVFYVKFVRPFLRQKDAYRQYWPNRMLNVSIERKTDVAGKVVNPKPLFKKVESKPKANPFSASAFAKPLGSKEEQERQARMIAAKKERERVAKARVAAQAQYAAKRAGQGKTVKPTTSKPSRPRNK